MSFFTKLFTRRNTTPSHTTSHPPLAVTPPPDPLDDILTPTWSPSLQQIHDTSLHTQQQQAQAHAQAQASPRNVIRTRDEPLPDYAWANDTLATRCDAYIHATSAQHDVMLDALYTACVQHQTQHPHSVHGYPTSLLRHLRTQFVAACPLIREHAQQMSIQHAQHMSTHDTSHMVQHHMTPHMIQHMHQASCCVVCSCGV